MNALTRLSKEALKAGARTFASSSLPDRKVAILGAAGTLGKIFFLLLLMFVLGALEWLVANAASKPLIVICLWWDGGWI